jgi:hypothetical protein
MCNEWEGCWRALEAASLSLTFSTLLKWNITDIGCSYYEIRAGQLSNGYSDRYSNLLGLLHAFLGCDNSLDVKCYGVREDVAAGSIRIEFWPLVSFLAVSDIHKYEYCTRNSRPICTYPRLVPADRASLLLLLTKATMRRRRMFARHSLVVQTECSSPLIPKTLLDMKLSHFRPILALTP